MIGRRQGHEGVIAVVIVTAEGAGIGERRGRDQLAEFESAIQLADEDRQQLVGRRLLQQRHERFTAAESQRVRSFAGKSR